MSDHYLKFLAKLKPKPSEKPASWADVTCVTPSKYPIGKVKTYIATIYPDWSFAEFALGGMLYALSLEATKKHAKISQPKLDLPDAVSSSINFFKPARVGQVVIEIDDLNLGGQYSNFRATIKQQDPKTKAMYQCTETLVTLGNLEKEAARPGQLNIPRRDHPLYKDEARTPPSRKGWVEIPIQDKVPGFYKTKLGLRMLYPPNSVFDNADGSQPHPEFGILVRDQWWRGTDPWTASHIPFCLDIQPPLHANFSQGYTYWGPTLSMSMDLYKRPAETRNGDQGAPAGAEWLWTRSELTGHSGGRYLSDFTIKDEEGDTVALARMVNLAIPYQSFSRDKDKKKTKDTRGKSKI